MPGYAAYSAASEESLVNTYPKYVVNLKELFSDGVVGLFQDGTVIAGGKSVVKIGEWYAGFPFVRVGFKVGNYSGVYVYPSWDGLSLSQTSKFVTFTDTTPNTMADWISLAETAVLNVFSSSDVDFLVTYKAALESLFSFMKE